MSWRWALLHIHHCACLMSAVSSPTTGCSVKYSGRPGLGPGALVLAGVVRCTSNGCTWLRLDVQNSTDRHGY